jgi:hypothetical protein
MSLIGFSNELLCMTLSGNGHLIGELIKVKRKLSRDSIEILSIKSACEFCKNMGVTPSIANISMVTGFSEEKILERIDHDFPAYTRSGSEKRWI